jgi:cytochrome c
LRERLRVGPTALKIPILNSKHPFLTGLSVRFYGRLPYEKRSAVKNVSLDSLSPLGSTTPPGSFLMHVRLACSALLLSCLVHTEAAATAGQVLRGRTFVEANCARCHAIGPTGTSPVSAAPPFRTLHTRYPVEDLAEALAEGITTGHPTMPEFELDPDQISDVVAYLKSLEH